MVLLCMLPGVYSMVLLCMLPDVYSMVLLCMLPAVYSMMLLCMLPGVLCCLLYGAAFALASYPGSLIIAGRKREPGFNRLRMRLI